MPMKRANSNDGGTKVTTLAFRYQVVKRRELELISAQKGHANLSDTLREYADEYIQKWRTAA
jgi:hypothetical protein